jgi:hypothetical protein
MSSLAAYLAPRGRSGERELPLCFFCLAGARSLRASGADSVKPCPTRGGHPKGLGLEGIREASYAIDVPAKQNGLLKRFWSSAMQQSQGIGYVDIVEVRTVTGAATCNQLLADGWVLLGVYPLTTVAEMTERQPSDGQQKQPQDTQRYVRRLVGYVVGRKRE